MKDEKRIASIVDEILKKEAGLTAPKWIKKDMLVDWEEAVKKAEEKYGEFSDNPSGKEYAQAMSFFNEIKSRIASIKNEASIDIEAYLKPPRWIKEEQMKYWDATIDTLEQKYGIGKVPYPAAIAVFKNKVKKYETIPGEAVPVKERRELGIAEPTKDLYSKGKFDITPKQLKNQIGDNNYGYIRGCIDVILNPIQIASQKTWNAIKDLRRKLKELVRKEILSDEKIAKLVADLDKYDHILSIGIKFRGKNTPAAARKKAEAKEQLNLAFKRIVSELTLAGF